MTQQSELTDRYRAFLSLQKVTELMSLTSPLNSPTISTRLSELRAELAQLLTTLTIKEKSEYNAPIDTSTPEINLGDIL